MPLNFLPDLIKRVVTGIECLLPVIELAVFHSHLVSRMLQHMEIKDFSVDDDVSRDIIEVDRGIA
jgi:hypothetical protein